MYINYLVHIDGDLRVIHNRKYKRKLIWSKRHLLIVMCGRACVYTNVYNVYGKEIALLRMRHLDTTNSWANHIISTWNNYRASVGVVPPHGWPLSMLLMTFAVLVTIMMCLYGYKKKYWKHRNITVQKSTPVTAVVYQSEQNDRPLQSKAISFDTDSSTIMSIILQTALFGMPKKIFFLVHMLNLIQK